MKILVKSKQPMHSAFHRTNLAVLALLVLTRSALAHTGTDAALGLQSGFLHPLTGLDHLVAMVAVGLWGAQLGNPAIWSLPITFPLVMAFGGLLGIAGVWLPFPEEVVALSGIALGALVALRVRAPLAVAVLIVGAFAIFHGYARSRAAAGGRSPPMRSASWSPPACCICAAS